MGKIVLENKKLVFQRRDELVVMEAYGKNCIRCRVTRNAKVSDEKWTLLDPVTEDACVVSGDEKVASLENGDIKVTIDTGFTWYGSIISYYRKDKLNFKMGNVIGVSAAISLDANTDWFTHGTGSTDLKEEHFTENE